MTEVFIEAFLYLCAAVIAVPLSKKLGLGSVLGYLVAGLMIGPVLGLVGEETRDIQHFAEFGVVMMLFLIGLELDPETIWDMRHKLLGLGGLQALFTIGIVTGVLILVGVKWQVALTIGCIFSLSSTAIVLQTFNEKQLMKTNGARNAFSVLLFQDIAVIPMLALIPLLSLPGLESQHELAASTPGAPHHDALNFVSELSSSIWVLLIIVSIAIVVIGGHYLSRPLFRYVAQSGLREVFTAAALMLVIGISALMSLVGLSPALGTFLAGVVLANSEFRHELETTLEPFKGLLLGLFFITVGAGINLDMLFKEFGTFIMLTLGLMMLKTLVLLCICLFYKIKGADRWLLALSLGQAGEFGFVLLSFSSQSGALSTYGTEFLSLVVAMSMFLTPGLFILYDKVILKILAPPKNVRPHDDIDEMGPVIVAGVGRFGQIVNRVLVASGVKTIVLDHEPTQIENLRKFNIKGYFGDASHPELLEKAGIKNAKILILTMDDQDSTIQIVSHVKKRYPHIKVLARAYDRTHEFQLKDVGADFVIKETFHGALDMGCEALCLMERHPFLVQKQKWLFTEIEKTTTQRLYASWKRHEQKNNFDMDAKALLMQVETLTHKTLQKEKHDARVNQEWQWPTKFNRFP